MSKNHLKFLIIILIVSSTLGNYAYSRKAEISELSSKYDYYNSYIDVNLDGSYEILEEYQITILNESGREQFSRLHFTYNEDSSKIFILEAMTIQNGKNYHLSADRIEDKPLASLGHGFDQIRQVFLSFPNLEINSKIKLKLRYKFFKPNLDGVFSTRLTFQGYFEKIDLKYNSKLPLNLKFNDPEGSLNLPSNINEKLYTLSINNVKPLNQVFVEEPEYGQLDPAKLTWGSLSSLNNWEELGLKLSSEYHQVMNQPLPKLFQNIANKSKLTPQGIRQKLLKKIDPTLTLIQNDSDQINQVTSLLNEKIQYMGDWRSIKGKFFPRSLEVIATSQVGDCKDFSVSTAAILKALGYKVQIVLVERGRSVMPDLNLPDLAHFNHAMLKVTNKTGKVYWIDPTNVVSMAQGLFPDISGRNVLVLDLKKPNYEYINQISAEHAKIISSRSFELKDQQLVNIHGECTLKGEAAIAATGMQLYATPKQIENRLFYALTGSYIDEDPHKSIILPDLTSRIVKDLKFIYQFTKKNQFINTNFGFGLKIPEPDFLYKVLDTNINQLSDLFMGDPLTEEREYIFKNMQIQNIDKLNYKIDLPWIYFSRDCINNKHNATIKDLIIVRSKFIQNSTILSDLFKNFKDSLEQQVKGSIVIID